jgi:thiamine-monophosphate kinase
MDEFDLITRYLEPLSPSRADVSIGIGDDGAVLKPTPGQEIVVVVDSLVAGVHFPDTLNPEDIGYRSVAVNLSDLAAMGAVPQWATLALTLPEGDPVWLEAFCEGFADALSMSDLILVGGDTTRGPLTVTVQLIGHVGPGTALTRGGARADDAIFVSGTLGDARAGLDLLVQQRDAGAGSAELIERFTRPTPRLQLGTGLRDLASSAIDISDGLLADLGHITEASGCGATVAWAALPLSPVLTGMHEIERARGFAATGGDDYELCFTVPQARIDTVPALAERCGCALTQIGTMTDATGVTCIDESNRPVELGAPGYRHF